MVAAAVDLDALSAEFPDFDRELLQGMLEDQGGDLQEVHACLRVSLRTPPPAKPRFPHVPPFSVIRHAQQATSFRQSKSPTPLDRPSSPVWTCALFSCAFLLLTDVPSALQRMKSQTLAAERKAKRAAAAADAGASASAARTPKVRKPATDPRPAAAVVQNLRGEPGAMDADQNGLADPGDMLQAEPAQPVEEGEGTGGSAAQAAKGGNRKRAAVKKREAAEDAPIAANKRSKGTR